MWEERLIVEILPPIIVTVLISASTRRRSAGGERCSCFTSVKKHAIKIIKFHQDILERTLNVESEAAHARKTRADILTRSLKIIFIFKTLFNY